MTAEALKTITNPRNTRIMVTVNSQPSTLTRFAMGGLFHHGDKGTRRTMSVNFEEQLELPWLVLRLRGQRPYHFLENLPAVLVVLKLIEAGARRGQQHNIAGFGSARGVSEGRFQGLRVIHLDAFN